MHRPLITAAVLAGTLAPLAATGGAQAAKAPSLDVPFRCKAVVLGKAWSGHSPANAIDFNGPGGGDSDLGMPVVASGPGKVIDSRRHTTNGYGEAIEIRHAGGVRTFYAHLQNRVVQKDATVKRGQLIGHLGKSSAKYTFSAHLHYEQRDKHGNDIVARFRGRVAPEYGRRNQSVKHVSPNCPKAQNPAPNPNPNPNPTPTPTPDPAPNPAGVALPGIAARKAATIRTDAGLPVIARRGPRTAAAEIRRFRDGQKVSVVCQTQGQQVTGKFGTSRLWNLVDLGGGRGAYVTDTYTYTGSDARVAPRCPA
jgi:hypothetical protein